MNVEDIRRVVGYLREHGAYAYKSDKYQVPIDPAWLATPERRYLLWTILERLEDLEAQLTSYHGERINTGTGSSP